MATERRVRFTEGFFTRLEALLPEERDVDGTPSVTDFIVFEIPPLRDRLAEDADGATLPIDDPAVRVIVATGVLHSTIALHVHIAIDEVVVFDLDLG